MSDSSKILPKREKLSIKDCLLAVPEYKEILDGYDKQIYDLTQLLELSRSLCTTLELSKLIESVLLMVTAQSSVIGTGIFIQKEFDSTEFTLDPTITGFDVDNEFDYSIPVDGPLAKILEEAKAFTMADLEVKIGNSKGLEVLRKLNPSLVVPLVVKNHLNGILILGDRFTENAEYSEYEIVQVQMIAQLASVAISNASLVEQASTDLMTKLKLKVYFFNILSDKLDEARTFGSPLSVMMFDIDHFKKFNDTYGHAGGDYVLIEVAKIIRKNVIRSQDMASRYGGEEFTVMLNETSLDDAYALAEKIRHEIENTDFFYDNQHMKVTISIGVAVYKDGNQVDTAKQLVEQADRALYVSKRNGRNRTTIFDPEKNSENPETSTEKN